MTPRTPHPMTLVDIAKHAPPSRPDAVERDAIAFPELNGAARRFLAELARVPSLADPYGVEERKRRRAKVQTAQGEP